MGASDSSISTLPNSPVILLQHLLQGIFGLGCGDDALPCICLGDLDGNQVIEVAQPLKAHRKKVVRQDAEQTMVFVKATSSLVGVCR